MFKILDIFVLLTNCLVFIVKFVKILYNIFMKIGIFGGTFNPPHNTHVNIARQAVAQLRFDKLLVVPCGIPPHKYCGVDKLVRLQLCNLAFAGVACSDVTEVWDYEIRKDTASYTVETLREVKRLYPDSELYLIIGGDSLANFSKWYRSDEIAGLATLAVADREKSGETNENETFRLLNANVVHLDVQPNDVSSTEIRLRYQFGKDNSSYVPRNVDEFVLKNKLYADYRDTALKLQGYLKPERFEHTFYVVKRGLEFASSEEYGKVFTACLLHDCAKYVSERDYSKYGFECPSNMPKTVVHSFLGAEVAKRDFNVCDEEVLNAIRYHTTGRPEMTRLDKIVYVADKTEQTRPYPLEHLLSGTLDEIFLKCLVEANEYRVEAHGDSDFELTNLTLKYYLNA